MESTTADFVPVPPLDELNKTNAASLIVAHSLH